jgi:hypothetical protein
MRSLAVRLRAVADTTEFLAATTKSTEVRQALSSFSQSTRNKADVVDALERA